MTVYISIGNSDDKLTQLEWSRFIYDVDQAINDAGKYVGTQIHGRWYSLPTEPWQNACWCLDIAPDLPRVIDGLRTRLRELAWQYRQHSIAWAPAQTEFLAADRD